ncbi:MAG: DUF6353 family protein [Lachnospiraceae bacterium]|nr:DUF6353 family protein [Lachnospiraceae bacterium]
MSKFTLPGFVKSIKSGARKHSPEILTAIGIGGMTWAVILSVKATPKALQLIEEAKDEPEDKLGVAETVKVAWKPYIPAAITGVGGAVCIIGASKVHHRRNAALATAYTLSESALREYKEKAVETIGEKKEKAVKDAIAKDKIEKNPVSNNTVILTNKGDTLCYDAVFGRYFKSDIDKIKKSVNELNRRLLVENYISVNEFYYELGVPSVKTGEDLGWNIDTGLIEIDFSSQLTEDGTPSLVLDFTCEPRYDFRNLY